jgi:DNA replication protein DnaC
MDESAPATPARSTTPPATARPTPRRTEAERRLLVARLAGQVGEKYGPKAAALAAYRAETPRQRAVLDRCRQAVDRLGELADQGRGLVWLGSTGTGKDHLMAALLYQAAWRHGLDCCWVGAEELFRKLRDAMDQDRTEAAVLGPYLACEVLAVSDPLPVQGGLGDWQARTFGALVDQRYRRNRPTWLTANAEHEADLRDRLTPPVADRLLEGAEVFKCFWPSFRRGQ